MRTENSAKNIVAGIGGQSLYTVLKLVSRAMFIYALGKQYLGINGLFTSIISVLSISELGVGEAIIYSLYSPIANKDYSKINKLMRFYKHAYTAIGTVIFVLGLSLVPFLDSMVNLEGKTDLINIYLVYILFLCETVSSYWFFAYKKSFLFASQKNYIVNLYEYSCKILFTILQIVSICFLVSFAKPERFYIYTILGILSNVSSNFLVKYYSDKHFKFLNESKSNSLSKEEKKPIFKNVSAISLYKICVIVVGSTDNIVLSSFLSNGTAIVGVYSNYYLITGTIEVFIAKIIVGFNASIGDLYASESKKKSEFVFKSLDLINFWLFGLTSICIWTLTNPFLFLMFGKNYVFPISTLLIITINYFVMYQTLSVNSFRNASGIYWQGKFRPVANVVLNIIISLFLVKPLGVNGVLLGTLISNLLTVYWFDPWLVYKHAFNMSSRKHFLKVLKNDIIILSLIVATYYLLLPLSAITWVNLIFKGVIVFIITNLVFFLVYRKTDEFDYCKTKIIAILNKLKNKIIRKESI